MPEITREQAAQLESDIGYMRKAGMTQDDIDRYVGSRLSEWGAVPVTEQTPGQQGLRGSQTAAAVTLPIAGGIAGSAMTAGRGVIPQFLGEVTGIATGDILGRAVSGQSQNVPESIATGSVGGVLGTGYRMGTRILGGVGRVPDVFVQEAGIPTTQPRIPFTDIKVPVGVPLPPIGKVTRALPRTARQVERGISAEDKLADRVRAASAELSNKLTPERAAKSAFIEASSESGVRIPVEPIKDALRSKLPMPESMEMSDFRLLNTKINQAISMLETSAAGQGGTISPSKADEIIRKVLRPKVYTGTGKVSNTLFADAIGEAERATTKLLSDALPGDVRAMNQTITNRLDAAEAAAKLFGEDRAGVVNRLRTIHKPGNEDSLKSLLVLSHETNDPQLAKDVMRLATKRAFAGDIREASDIGSGGFFGLEARTPARQVARVMAPFQAYVGPIAAEPATQLGKRIGKKVKNMYEERKRRGR